MESHIVSGPQVREVLNILTTKEGSFKRLDMDANGVLVQLLERSQEDGTVKYERVVSIVCVDERLLPQLREEARRILAIEAA